MAEQKTPKQKGDALEQTVKAIELSILRMEPKAAEQNFTIETKKLIKVDNVPHEIDVYVTVHFAAGYDAIFIFECKNWAQPVDKNEIIIFSEKIQVSGAAHGYFVAKSFTAGAKAQAEKDKRMVLLPVTEHDPLLLAPQFSQKGLRETIDRIGLNIIAKDGSRLICPDPSLEITYVGNQTSLTALVMSWANEATSGKASRLLEQAEPGEHELNCEFLREFATGELHILGKDIEKIYGVVVLKIVIFQYVIEYSFDVESRGRVVSFAPVHLPDGEIINSRFVITYKDKSSIE